MRPFVADPEQTELVGLVGGLNDTSPIGFASLGEASVAENVEFSRGTISNRRGRARIGDQIDPGGSPGVGDRVCFWMYQFRTRNLSINRRMRVNGTHLYKLVDNNWIGAISGTNPGGASDVFGGGVHLGTSIQFNDRIYYADGDEQKRYDGSTIRDWSYAGGTLPAPTDLVAIGSGGSLGAGNYTMVYTYYDPLVGEETNPSSTSASVTVVANDKFTFTIPKNTGWTANYARIRIYRTTVNGAGAWYYEKQIDLGAHDLASADLTVGINADCYCSVSDSSLGSEVEYDNDGIPSGIGIVFLHDERVIGIDPTSSTVYYSKKGRPWSWPTANAQDLLKEDGHPCIGGFVMYGLPYVWKRGGPGFQLQPHPTLGYQPQQLPFHHGMESHWSIVADANHVFWVDKGGFVQFNGQQTINASDPKIRELFSSLSRSESDYLQRVYGINHNQPDRQQMTWCFSDLADNDDLLLNLFLPSYYGGGGGWHRHTYGTYGIRVFCRHEDPSTMAEWVECSDGNGCSYRLRANTTDPPSEMYTDDSTEPILARWESCWIGNGVDGQIDWFDIFHEKASSGNDSGLVYFYVWVDGDESAPVMTKSFAVLDTGAEINISRFGFLGRRVRRYKLGFSASSAAMDLSIVKVAVWGRNLAPMLVGAA